MWGETVDASDIQATVWYSCTAHGLLCMYVNELTNFVVSDVRPRMAAIAERLWSPRALINDTQAALPRMEAFRCLLNRRGIGAAPVTNPVARDSPHGPGSCFKQ